MTHFVVVGAFVVDVLVETETLPAWGVEAPAERITTAPGGKALNQAVVLARGGARVSALGAVGGDIGGALVLDTLRAEGIEVDSIEVDESAPTATCLVFSRRSDGANAIMFRGSGSTTIGAAAIEAAGTIERADAVLVTFEVPPATVRRTIELARRQGAFTVVSAAGRAATGYADLPWAAVDLVVANEAEARDLLAATGEPTELAVDELPAALADRLGSRTVAVTLGARGSALWADGSLVRHPAPSVSVVDTSAAGDAFTATLAFRMARGDDATTAISAATSAAGVTVSRSGGYAALP